MLRGASLHDTAMMRRILVSAALCVACAEPSCPTTGTPKGQTPTAFHLATAHSCGSSVSKPTTCSKMIMAPPAANRGNQGSKMLYSRLVSSIKAPLSSWLPSFGNAPKTIESVEQMAHCVDVCKVPPHTVHTYSTLGTLQEWFTVESACMTLVNVSIVCLYRNPSTKCTNRFEARQLAPRPSPASTTCLRQSRHESSRAQNPVLAETSTKSLWRLRAGVCVAVYRRAWRQR